MIDLLQTANYLHILGLVEHIRMEVAKCLYNEKNESLREIKTPEELCKVFHIVNDLEYKDEDKDGANESKKKKIEEKESSQLCLRFLFYYLVTAKVLNPHEYKEIVRQPLDLSTTKDA